MTLVRKPVSLPSGVIAAVLLAVSLTACSFNEAELVPPAAAQQADDSEVALTIRTAETEMRDGNLAEAGRLLDDARAENPENPAVWVAIARLRFRGGEHLSAIVAADRALELGPGFAPALLMRGQLVRDANGLYESLIWFEAAVEADPKNAEAMGEYAATLGDLGQNQEMLKAVRKLAEIEPENDQALYLQAVLAARAGEPVMAQSLLERSEWREIGIPAAMMLGAVIDIEQGNADTATETLAQLAKRQPANSRVRELYARALWQAGRDEKLIEELTPAIEQPDASAYLTMLVGRAHERLGNRAAAAPLIAKAYRDQKSGWSVLSSEAVLGGNLPAPTKSIRVAIASGEIAAADAQAAQLKRQFDQSADILALAGDVALAQGKAGRALDNYSESARVRRPWPMARKIVASLRSADENRAADNLLSRYALGDPRNGDALIAVLRRAFAKEEWERCALLADYAIALGAGQDPSVLTMRIDAARAMGDDDALARYEVLLQAVRPSKLVRN